MTTEPLPVDQARHQGYWLDMINADAWCARRKMAGWDQARTYRRWSCRRLLNRLAADPDCDLAVRTFGTWTAVAWRYVDRTAYSR